MDPFLANLPLLQALPPALRKEAMRAMPRKRYGKGESIFDEGDAPEAVFLLSRGLVKAVKYSPRSQPFTMELIVPPRLFGMVAALDRRPYPVTAIALTEVDAYRIALPLFQQLQAQPAFSQLVYQQMGEHLRHGQALRSLQTEPADKRIAYVLVLLQESLGKTLAVRREDIADIAATTVETTIRTLADFKRRRLIATGWKRITLVDPAGLRALAEAS